MADEKEKFNKNSKAVALKFEKEKDEAPRVVAKGQAEIAAMIVKVAKEHGVEIREDANLVEVLHALELDDFIPLEAYTAVAEILRFIYQKQGKKI